MALPRNALDIASKKCRTGKMLLTAVIHVGASSPIGKKMPERNSSGRTAGVDDRWRRVGVRDRGGERQRQCREAQTTDQQRQEQLHQRDARGHGRRVEDHAERDRDRHQDERDRHRVDDPSRQVGPARQGGPTRPFQDPLVALEGDADRDVREARGDHAERRLGHHVVGREFDVETLMRDLAVAQQRREDHQEHQAGTRR